MHLRSVVHILNCGTCKNTSIISFIIPLNFNISRSSTTNTRVYMSIDGRSILKASYSHGKNFTITWVSMNSPLMFQTLCLTMCCWPSCVWALIDKLSFSDIAPFCSESCESHGQLWGSHSHSVTQHSTVHHASIGLHKTQAPGHTLLISVMLIYSFLLCSHCMNVLVVSLKTTYCWLCWQIQWHTLNRKNIKWSVTHIQ